VNRPRWLAWAAIILARCTTAPDVTPEILDARATAGTENVLSAVVTLELGSVDSVAVRYASTGAPALNQTPVQVRPPSETEILVLGLMPETTYRFEAVAWRGDAMVVHDLAPLTTGAVPDDLPTYVAGGEKADPGFVAFAAGSFGLVIDNTGRVVWYHRFPNGPGLNFMAQPDGRYVARPSTPETTEQGAWIEIDPAGRQTRSLTCHGGLTPRPHDMIALEDGSYWLLCDDVRTLDLRAMGGLEHVRVTGTAVQHLGASGALLFQWTPFSAFSLADLDPGIRAAPAINWTHGNAIDLTPDGGTLVISFRNLNEITAIDTRTGLVKWRLGGAHSDFTFEGVTPPAFVGQHGLRLVGGGVQLLDNLGNPTESRVERYRLDPVSRTATLVAAYPPSVRVVAQLGGTTQALADGHTLVSYGNGGRVEEYDAAGHVVWQIMGSAGYVFRAQRIRSLYSPGTGDR